MVIVRVLSVEDAGSFFLVFTSLAILATFCRFGADNLVLKICGRGGVDMARDVSFAVGVALFATVAGVTVVIVVLSVVGYRLSGVGPEWNPLLVASVIPQAFSVIAGAILRARRSLALGVLAELGSVPLFATLFVLGSSHFGTATLSSALLALSLSSWLTLAWSAPAAVRALKSERGSAPNSTDFVVFVKSNGGQLAAMMGTSLLFYVLTWAPVYVLSATSTLASVSYFTAAMRLANFVSLVPSLQVSYLAPEFARLFHRGALSGLNELTKGATRQAALVLLVPVAAMIFGAQAIVGTLYGADYLVAADVLIILAAAAYVVALGGHVSPLMLLCGLERVAFWLNVGAVVVWAAAGLPAAAAAGAVGVAWVSVFVSVTYTFFAAVMLKRGVGVRSYVR
ncbi:hypothetical protein C3E77_02900 [Mycetocola zhujimingii]|nr:hypothetical protein C3E77_02900 [Mycetocola zhujimingii]